MYKSMKNNVKKVVSEAMREKAEKGLMELKNCPNRMFKMVKGLGIGSKYFERERCMKGSDSKLDFSENGA